METVNIVEQNSILKGCHLPLSNALQKMKKTQVHIHTDTDSMNLSELST